MFETTMTITFLKKENCSLISGDFKNLLFIYSSRFHAKFEKIVRNQKFYSEKHKKIFKFIVTE